eukprot:TRINITY_DN5718_c0_g3_i1.p1 TRINITY_DN5718_c0_g3~~TRINITY_DN5718_c0_g3_i1.p1  ORF type:complete len:753 (+),score=164.08 TRINITY_DN5718_c0_g3_i1:413-2671(+)
MKYSVPILFLVLIFSSSCWSSIYYKGDTILSEDEVNITFIYNALKPVCLECSSNETKNEYYVCANSSSNPNIPPITYNTKEELKNTIYSKYEPPVIIYSDWNRGLLEFFDPIPDNTYLYQVDLTLNGRFNCANDSLYGVAYIATLGNGVISFGYMDPSPRGCECPNCGSTVKLSSQPQTIWTDYKYHNSNVLDFYAYSELCISTIVVTLKVKTTKVTNMTPMLGPAGASVKISVIGENFLNESDVVNYCTFSVGPVVMKEVAQFINTSCLLCFTPPNLSVGNYNLTVFMIIGSRNHNISIPFNFYSYSEPAIQSLEPSKGNRTGGNSIYLKGSGFFNEKSLKVKFGNQESSNVTFISDMVVSCVVPEYVNGQATILVLFSENGQDFTASGPQYTYSNVNDDDDSRMIREIFKYGLISVGSLVALIIIIVLIVLAINFRKQSRRQHLSEKSPLINSLGNSKGLTELELEHINPEEIEIKKRIGRGSFGEVFKAKWRGINIAVKKLPKHMMSGKFVDSFVEEISITNTLRHPNILQVLGVCIDGNNILMLTEYIQNGSLYQVLHNEKINLDWPKIQKMLLDAARGMNYLHKRKVPIIHRDLKSHNLLVDENFHIRICDFGLSRILENQEKTMTACGTPCWTAPEVLRNERYSESADVYSFGIVLWECITRKDPYDGLPPFQVVYAVGNQGKRPDMPDINPYPDALMDLMKQCWEEIADNRPTFLQVVNSLTQITEKSSYSSSTIIDISENEDKN